MSHEADELVLYADNDEPLYRQSFMPIVENLKKKLKKGTYSPLLAAKLWRYHADRAAQKYVKEFGGGTWHKVFSTKDRNEAAAHWESYARREYLGVTSHDRSRTRRRSPAGQKRRDPSRPYSRQRIQVTSKGLAEMTRLLRDARIPNAAMVARQMARQGEGPHGVEEFIAASRRDRSRRKVAAKRKTPARARRPAARRKAPARRRR